MLRALVEAVQRFRDEGRRADVIFATGDIGFAGKPGEYAIATTFFSSRCSRGPPTVVGCS